MVTMPVSIWTDGSSIRNPGPSGCAYILKYFVDKEDGIPEAKEIEFSQGYRLSTNNRMEIMAAIFALRKFIEMVEDGTFIDVRQVNLTSDSDYLVRAINQNWISKWQTNGWMTSSFQNKKPHEVINKDLWEQIIQIQDTLKAKHINLVLAHVNGHSGDEYNERCDKLAVAASDKEMIKDEVYESNAKTNQ